MTYFKEELDQYPELLSKEQFRKVCHISKRTALFLLEFDLIPHIETGKKTHSYKIRKTDVIAFIKDRSVNPHKYIAPENWYSSAGISRKAYKVRLIPAALPCAADMCEFYRKKIAPYREVLTVMDVSMITGYGKSAVRDWISLGKLKALSLPNSYAIPKEYLLDWLCSDQYNSIIRKSKSHVDALWEMNKN